MHLLLQEQWRNHQNLTLFKPENEIHIFDLSFEFEGYQREPWMPPSGQIALNVCVLFSNFYNNHCLVVGGTRTGPVFLFS